jgi:predicted DNA binding protein
MDAFRTWAETIGQRHRVDTSNGGLFITDACACTKRDRPSISDLIVKVGVWDIPPVVYQGGWESWRVVAWNEPSVRDLFTAIREIGELKISNLRPIENGRMEQMMLMPASDVFAGLTARQLQALNLGLDHGYYSTPSETDVGKLAQGLGLSNSTLAEHLRKAESRVLRNLRPYLQVYSDREAGEVVVGEVRRAPLRLPSRASRTRRRARSG